MPSPAIGVVSSRISSETMGQRYSPVPLSGGCLDCDTVESTGRLGVLQCQRICKNDEKLRLQASPITHDTEITLPMYMAPKVVLRSTVAIVIRNI